MVGFGDCLQMFGDFLMILMVFALFSCDLCFVFVMFDVFSVILTGFEWFLVCIMFLLRVCGDLVR